MRAGRLIALTLLLQRGGRLTASALAAELEVSERTVLRDLDELCALGVRVSAVRGPGGGFQLLDGDQPNLVAAGRWTADERSGRIRRRARVRITAEGRRLAAVLGRPSRLVVRPDLVRPDMVLPDVVRPDGAAEPSESVWLEATFPIRSLNAATLDVIALADQVEVIEPLELRHEVAERLRRAAVRYSGASEHPT